jgi:hypothetical protein
MRPTLNSLAIAALIGGCAAAGIAVASAGTPHDRAEHGRSAVSPAATSQEPLEHATAGEAAHRGRDDNSPSTVPVTREAAETAHPELEPGDDNGGVTEPGDDRGGATEPADDRGGATEPGDDNGGATEPADDRSSTDNRGPGGDDDNSGSGGDHSGPGRGSDG